MYNYAWKAGLKTTYYLQIATRRRAFDRPSTAEAVVESKRMPRRR